MRYYLVFIFVLFFGPELQSCSYIQSAGTLANTFWISKDYYNNRTDENFNRRSTVLYFKGKDYYEYSGYLLQKGDSIYQALDSGWVLKKGVWGKVEDMVFTQSKILEHKMELPINPLWIHDFIFESNYQLKENELIYTDSIVYVPLKQAVSSDLKYIFLADYAIVPDKENMNVPEQEEKTSALDKIIVNLNPDGVAYDDSMKADTTFIIDKVKYSVSITQKPVGGIVEYEDFKWMNNIIEIVIKKDSELFFSSVITGKTINEYFSESYEDKRIIYFEKFSPAGEDLIELFLADCIPCADNCLYYSYKIKRDGTISINDVLLIEP